MLKGTRERLRATKDKGTVLRCPAAGMLLTFRAEVMPGRETVERTFKVARVLASARVELMNLQGEHAVTEFEPLPA
jgi:hypothetical protein